MKISLFGILTAKKTSVQGLVKIGAFSAVRLLPSLEYVTYCTHAQYRVLL